MLEDIKTISIPGISEATGAYLCEGCVVCMNRQSHSSGVQLSLKGDKTASIPTEWSMAYTDQLDRSWQDQEVATEHGHCLRLSLNFPEFGFQVAGKSLFSLSPHQCGRVQHHIRTWTFAHLFVQNEVSKELLATIGVTDVTVVGDTRFDRVLDICHQAKQLPL